MYLFPIGNQLSMNFPAEGDSQMIDSEFCTYTHNGETGDGKVTF